MMNYKLVHAGIGEIKNTHGKYGTAVYDIIETKTNQVIREKVPEYMNEAKNLCRHLNMGGGFDGFTPAFFLAQVPVVEFGDAE